MYWNKGEPPSSNSGDKINRNMRCIEIQFFLNRKRPLKGLIETWDVLKYRITSSKSIPSFWLIETWDVLKCYKVRIECTD